MNGNGFRHDWEAHVWWSAARQTHVGYWSCRTCGRGEWLSGAVSESEKMTEEECQAIQDSMIGRPQFVQLQLFTDGFA